MVWVGIIQAQEKSKDTIRMNQVTIDVKKHNQKIQKIPVSATAVSAKELEILKADDITDINAYIPNVFMPEHGTRLNTDIYVRGIGVSKGEPSVGIYVDDIPYFDSGTINFEFADIKQLEFLRGPQGTLYGRNTMGGLLKIYTPDPVSIQKAKIKLDLGTYNQYKTWASLNQPIGKKSGIIVDGFYKYNQGYFDNIFDNKKADEIKTYGGRIKFKTDINDKLSAKILMNYEKNYQPGFAYGIYDSATQSIADVNYNEPSKYDRNFGTTGINLNYKLKNYSINFSGSYQKLKDIYLIDQDFTPQDIYVVNMARNNDAFVEELNIKSQTESKFQWIGGFFAFQRNLLKDVDFSINTAHGKMDILKNYDQNINGYAVFGQGNYSLNKFILSAGLRYDREYSQMLYNYDLLTGGNKIHKDDFDHSLSFNQILPKISMSYLPNDNITLYTSITKGYKAGGFNATIERPEDETFDPEYSINYETGLKYVAQNNKFFGNMSLFYINWEQQQVVQSVPSGRGIMIKNAGKSESKGFELETGYRVNSQLDFGLSFGYTNANFIQYKYNEDEDFSGNKLPLVPEYTLALMGNYKWKLKNSKIKYILLHTDYKGVGKYYWNTANTDYQNPYGVLNASVNLKLKRYVLGIWGKNLTKTQYTRYYFTISTLNKAYAEKAKPLSFGIYLKAQLF